VLLEGRGSWGGEERRPLVLVEDGVGNVAGAEAASGISVSEACEESEDVFSLSLSTSPSSVTCGNGALEDDANSSSAASSSSSSSSSPSEPSGVGEWLMKRAGGRASAGEERAEPLGLTDRDLLSCSWIGSILAMVASSSSAESGDGVVRVFASWLLAGASGAPFVVARSPISHECSEQCFESYVYSFLLDVSCTS